MSPAARHAVSPSTSGVVRTAALTLATAAALLSGGCATTQLAVDVAAPRPVSVRIDGLSFLQLATTREEVIQLAASHGYQCADEASSAFFAPCTAEDPRARPAAFVLQFHDGMLRSVRLPTVVGSRDVERAMMNEFDRASMKVGSAFVERNGSVVVARLVPGDGSVVEMRYVDGLNSYETVHRTVALPQNPAFLPESAPIFPAARHASLAVARQ